MCRTPGTTSTARTAETTTIAASAGIESTSHPPRRSAGKSIYLKFDGANLTSDLWVNGNFVGEHKGGYSAFGWDVSSYLTVGADNVLAVKVTNASDSNVPPLAGDYTMDGGIYRHVNLIGTDPQHVALQEFVPADTSVQPVGPTVATG